MRGYVTARWLTLIRLAAALLIVIGLAVSVPPSFSASSGDHFGLLLHPLFPHPHATSHVTFITDDGAPHVGDFPSLSGDHEVAALDHLPGIRGQAAHEGFRSALGGIVLPVILAGLLLQLRQARQTELRLDPQHRPGPPTPPPRSSTTVVTY